MFGVLLISFGLTIAVTKSAQTDGETRIVNGASADIKSLPYMVQLIPLPNGNPICGGSILNDQWVLTAAHCFLNWPEETLGLRFGATKFRSSEKGVPIRRVIRHQQFDPHTYNLDVAVVQTYEPIRFNASSRPIQMAASAVELLVGTSCVVAGYGDTRTDHWPRSLAWTKVYVQDYERCQRIYQRLQRTDNYTFSVTNNTLCANDPGRRTDACQGDSGGALVCKGRIYGIVSHGFGCAEPKYPGVYTKLPAVRGWIKHWTGI